MRVLAINFYKTMAAQKGELFYRKGPKGSYLAKRTLLSPPTVT